MRHSQEANAVPQDAAPGRTVSIRIDMPLELPDKCFVHYRESDISVHHASPNRMPARASPPERPIGVPSARQQAAPVSWPSSWNWMAFMPPATVDITATL